MRVLIVDDDLEILESTQILLELEGHTVQTLQSAAGELAALDSFHPHVVLQDANMPGLDLDVTIAALRARAVSVILFTAAGDAEQLQNRLRTDALVRKPFDVDALLKTIERVGRAAAGTAG